MEALIKLLLTLIQKVPFVTELEQEAATDLVRVFAEHVGHGSLVPPKRADQPTPEPPPAVDPGPVAEPVPAAEQVPPPTSLAPDANAFAAAADDVPGSP